MLRGILLKKLILTISFLLLVILSACNIEYLSFEGKGENWFAKQNVSQIDGREESNIVIQYIGEDLVSVKNTTITFFFKNGKGSTSGTMSLNEGGVLETRGVTCEGCAQLKENDKIAFTIEWGNSKKESFSLISK